MLVRSSATSSPVPVLITQFLHSRPIHTVGHLDGTLAVWKYLFLIYGSVTVFLGVLVVFLLPDSPQTAWFLSVSAKEMNFELSLDPRF